MADHFTRADVREALSPTWYTDAARAVHDRDCARCRTLTEGTNATAAQYGASIRRRDRTQLGLHLTTDSDTDMDEALRRARAGRVAVAP